MMNLKNMQRAALKFFVLLLIVINAKKTKAQLDPLAAQYFQNQYLANPAMAGYHQGFSFNASMRQQWSSIPGAPTTRSITADGRVTPKVGVGLNVFNDGAGLIRNNRVMGTYAYHLPVNNQDQQLHFGLSLGFMDERLLNENIDADPNDLSVGKFQRRETYVDGDFGVAYTDPHLSIQAAIPNMKRFFGRDDNEAVDFAVFYSAISYKWTLGEEFTNGSVEPKVAFRGVRGYDNLLDLGANFTFIDNQVILSAMYHSSKSATFGFGMNYKAFSVLGVYTTQTAELQGYTNGNFEIGLKYQYFKK